MELEIIAFQQKDVEPVAVESEDYAVNGYVVHGERTFVSLFESYCNFDNNMAGAMKKIISRE